MKRMAGAVQHMWPVAALLLAAAVIMPGGATPAYAEDAESRDLPEKVLNFRLTDYEGRSHELYRMRDAEGIVLYFQGNGCPIVRQSLPKIHRLAEKYSDDGIEFLMINPNLQDDAEAVAKEAEEFDIELPVLMDERQSVTRMLGTQRTAEAILIEPKRWRIMYRGSVDDRFDYGARKDEAENEYLMDAIDAFLAGGEPDPAFTETKGCLINLLPAPEQVSYAHDIVPILSKKCMTCHIEGNIGPFEMESHRDVAGWGRMIKQVVLDRRMPPWHADDNYGEWANHSGLTMDEERKLLAWLDAGAPKGGEEDPLQTAAKRLSERKTAQSYQGWHFGKPDLVVQVPEPYDIPPEGVLDYEYTYVRPKLEKDQWVRAVQVRPTSLEATHHVLVFLQYPSWYEHLQRDQQAGLEGYFAGYVPGQNPEPAPEGTGKFLPKGSIMIFQLHYNTTGKPHRDQTEMALWFHDAPPERELQTHAVNDLQLFIPPHDPNYVTEASYVMPEAGTLYSFAPHMHYRGSWFEYYVQKPDGPKEKILSVPYYDFNWQLQYRLEEPMHLPEGTVITARGAHDNSARNPFNPDPAAYVEFGEQTYEEMFIGYFDYAPDSSDTSPEKIRAPRAKK